MRWTLFEGASSWSRTSRLASIGLALSACAPITVGEACDETEQAVCERITFCVGGTSTDTANCESGATQSCCGQAGTCQRTVANPHAPGDCVNAVRNSDCGAWQQWLQATSSPNPPPPPLPAVCLGAASPQ
jgi:hypothetical protein